jgi:hypothetical protein
MALTLDKIFYLYAAAAGLVAGLLWVQVPATRDFVIPPFFWIVLAIGLFEVGNALVPRGDRAPVISHLARVAGLCIGLAVMGAVTLYAGAPVRFI